MPKPSDRATPGKSTPRVGIADKPAGDACFNDWKRFCFVLREIASGEDGRPLTSFEAQKRAREVLTDCGYSWPGQAGAKQLRGALDPVSSTDKATVRQHLKEQLRQLKRLNAEQVLASAAVDSR
jgi:hypothetical protein